MQWPAVSRQREHQFVAAWYNSTVLIYNAPAFSDVWLELGAPESCSVIIGCIRVSVRLATTRRSQQGKGKYFYYNTLEREGLWSSNEL